MSASLWWGKSFSKYQFGPNIASLVPGPALCPDTGAAERLQETLYSMRNRF
jgi:hypothetical protein